MLRVVAGSRRCRAGRGAPPGHASLYREGGDRRLGRSRGARRLPIRGLRHEEVVQIVPKLLPLGALRIQYFRDEGASWHARGGCAGCGWSGRRAPRARSSAWRCTRRHPTRTTPGRCACPLRGRSRQADALRASAGRGPTAMPLCEGGAWRPSGSGIACLSSIQIGGPLPSRRCGDTVGSGREARGCVRR